MTVLDYWLLLHRGHRRLPGMWLHLPLLWLLLQVVSYGTWYASTCYGWLGHWEALLWWYLVFMWVVLGCAQFPFEASSDADDEASVRSMVYVSPLLLFSMHVAPCADPLVSRISSDVPIVFCWWFTPVLLILVSSKMTFLVLPLFHSCLIMSILVPPFSLLCMCSSPIVSLLPLILIYCPWSKIRPRSFSHTFTSTGTFRSFFQFPVAVTIRFPVVIRYHACWHCCVSVVTIPDTSMVS